MMDDWHKCTRMCQASTVNRSNSWQDSLSPVLWPNLIGLQSDNATLSSRSARFTLARSKARHELDRIMTEQLDPESISMRFGADDKSEDRNRHRHDNEKNSFFAREDFFFVQTRGLYKKKIGRDTLPCLAWETWESKFQIKIIAVSILDEDAQLCPRYR